MLETVIGSDSQDGIRGMLRQMSEQISALTEAVNSIRLTQAKASGNYEGAAFVGRLVWAVAGGAIAAGIMRFLK